MDTLDEVERLLALAKQRNRLLPSDEPDDCPYCGKRFRTILSMVTHRQLHERYCI